MRKDGVVATLGKPWPYAQSHATLWDPTDVNALKEHVKDNSKLVLHQTLA